MKKAILATVVASTFSIPAFAAGPEPIAPEAVVQAPLPVPAPFWEGGYVGGQLGYGFSSLELGAGDTRNIDDANGFIGGLMAGYLFSVGNGWYVGPEIQYDFMDLTIEDPDNGATADFDEMARLKLRAGREVGPGLLYGSLGAAFASIGEGNLNSLDDLTGDDTGYLFGIGYDVPVSDRFSVGAEYMYHIFDDIGDSGAEVDVNTIHLRGSYHF
ncbi:MAG: autotransporter outer membrane beta-barrel domain-containing protein [Pseudomonadota bacterium]